MKYHYTNKLCISKSILSFWDLMLCTNLLLSGELPHILVFSNSPNFTHWSPMSTVGALTVQVLGESYHAVLKVLFQFSTKWVTCVFLMFTLYNTKSGFCSYVLDTTTHVLTDQGVSNYYMHVANVLIIIKTVNLEFL